MKGFWGRFVVAGEQHHWPAQIYSGCTCVKVERLASIEGYPQLSSYPPSNCPATACHPAFRAFVSGHIIKGEAAKNLPPTLPSSGKFLTKKVG